MFAFTVFSKISRPGRPVKLYFSVPVDLYTVFSDPKNPGQKPGQKSGQKSGQNFGQKSRGGVFINRRCRLLHRVFGHIWESKPLWNNDFIVFLRDTEENLKKIRKTFFCLIFYYLSLFPILFLYSSAHMKVREGVSFISSNFHPNPITGKPITAKKK